MKTKLTAKQALFVKEYLVDLNATQAAIRAGYSQKTAKSVGSENLTKPDIAEAIEFATKDRNEKLDLDADIYVKRTEAMAKTTLKEFVKYDPDRGEYIYKTLEEIPEEAWYGVKKMEMIELPNGSGRAMRLELFDPAPHMKNGLTMNGKLVEKHEHTGSFNITMSSKDADTL